MHTYNPVPKSSVLYFVTFIVILGLLLSVCQEKVDAKPFMQPKNKVQEKETSSFGSFFGTFGVHKETANEESMIEETTAKPKSGGVHRSKEVIVAKEKKKEKSGIKPFGSFFNFRKKEEGKLKKEDEEALLSSEDEIIVSNEVLNEGKEGEIVEISPEIMENLPQNEEVDSAIISTVEENTSEKISGSAENTENHEFDLEANDIILTEITETDPPSSEPIQKTVQIGEEKEIKEEQEAKEEKEEAVPELEFIELAKKEPVLNVLPQRLSSPVETSRPLFENDESVLVSTLTAGPNSSEALVRSRIGNQAPNPGLENQTELKVFTHLPENFLVGVKTQLEVEVVNPGEVNSEQSSVEIRLPAWLQVTQMDAEKGIVKIVPAENMEIQKCIWNVGSIEPNTHKKMILLVIPQQKNEAKIEVSWSNQQISSNSTIVSEEPQIQMEIVGPNNIQERKETEISIRISNTGQCAIKDLNLICTAEGCQSQKYFVPGIHNLQPGEKESVEVNIMPASREKVQIHVDALIQERSFGTSDLEMTVNYTDLQIHFQVPQTCFVGKNQKIPLEISNCGNVPVGASSLCVELPPHLEFTGESLGMIEKDPLSGLTKLNISPMQVGETRNFTLFLKAKEECDLELPVGILVNSRTVSETKIPLHFEGVANVQMELNIPSGVLTTSEPGIYEIHLENTGSQKIDDGKLLVFFSEGFEPLTSMNGGQILEGGIVSFDVPPLIPGESTVFQIKAQATIQGNYPIRCQLKSEKYHLDLLQQGTAIFR